MTVLESSMAYAGDFERSYEDDDWDRIIPYFADDAVYEVASEVFGSTMKGPAAIIKGLKKSLDGFDRKFATRTIELIGQPEIDGDEIRLQWSVLYTQDGVAPYQLNGRSTVRLSGDKIVYLADHYDADADAALIDWRAKNDLEIDPSYT